MLALVYAVSVESFAGETNFPLEYQSVQDSFPPIIIDTTETFEQVDFTAAPEDMTDSVPPANAIEEFEKRMELISQKGQGRKFKVEGDSRSTPYIVNGEIVASHVDQKTKDKRARLWKEINPADEIRRQMKINQSLLEKYEKNLKVAESIKNDLLVVAMERKIDYTRKRIKEQKRALKKIK